MSFKIGHGKTLKIVRKSGILVSQKPPKIIHKIFKFEVREKLDFSNNFQLFFNKFRTLRPLILSPWPVFPHVFSKIRFGTIWKWNLQKTRQKHIKNGSNPWKNQCEKHIVLRRQFLTFGVSILEDFGLRNCSQFAFWPTFYAPGNHFGRFVGPLSSVLDDFGANCEESGRERARPNGILESQKHNLETLEMH